MGRLSQFLEWLFPINGIERQHEFGEQPALTTPIGVNVRAFEPGTDRARGGSRPGIDKYLSEQLPSGANVIQHLSVIVDPQAPLLGLSFSPGDETTDDTSDGNRNLLDDGTTRKIRVGGSGIWTHPEADQSVEDPNPDPISLVQTKTAGQGDPKVTDATTVTATLDAEPTANNLIVVFVAMVCNNADSPTVAVTNGKSPGADSYTQVGDYVQVNGVGDTRFRLSMWYRVAGVITADEQEVNVNFSGIGGSGASAFVAAIEYENTLASSVLTDSSSNADDTFTEPMTTGEIAVSELGQVVVAAFMSGLAIDTFTAGAGFTKIIEHGDGTVDNTDIQFLAIHALDQSENQEPTAVFDGGPQEYVAIGASFRWAGGA